MSRGNAEQPSAQAPKGPAPRASRRLCRAAQSGPQGRPEAGPQTRQRRSREAGKPAIRRTGQRH